MRYDIGMSNATATRTEAHANARSHLALAHARYALATTKKAKRDAAEDIEFWGNKAAMLSIEKGWA